MNWVKQLELAISIGPTLVTGLFIAIFLGTLIWIYRPGSKRYYEQQAHLPLEDSAAHPQHQHRNTTVSERPNG